jgi:hypothetical protein
MKLYLVLIASIIALTACQRPLFEPPHSNKFVTVHLSDIRHGSGSAGMIDTRIGQSSAEFNSGGTYGRANGKYKIINLTSTGFTLEYDITATRTPNSPSKRYQGNLFAAFQGKAPEVKLEPDYILSVTVD